jgi:hypothetical protein
MSLLRKRLDNKRYKRYSNPPSNNMKKRLQLEAHRIYKESIPTFGNIKGSDCEIGKNWGLYLMVIAVSKKRHPGPISAP